MNYHNKKRWSIIVWPIIVTLIVVLTLFFLHTPPEGIEITSLQENVSINSLLSNEMSDSKGTQKLDKQIEKFLNRWEIKGGSLAVIKEGKLIYAKGYGWADKELGIKTGPNHIFRVASLSKLITATAIMKMAEDSLITLDDKVFGKDGILNDEIFSHYKDKRVERITIEHLLRHQGGFTTSRGDPLFTTREIMIWEKIDTIPSMDNVIEYALKQRLGFTPGSSTRYSNVGYLILSKIIEKMSGVSYEEYCQRHILHPAKCYDMHLAKNLYEERYDNEVRYYEPHDATPIPAYNNSGDTLYRSYGGNNIEGLYGAGGWVSSPSEFALFTASIDGENTIPDILSQESVEKMIRCIGGELPIGWSRASFISDWKRSGTLAGSSALVKKEKDGTIWMFVTNTSSWKGNKFPRYIESMMRRATHNIEFPDQNLLELF